MKIRSNCPVCCSTYLGSQPALLMPFIANRVFGWEPDFIDNSWELNDIPQGPLTFGCRTFHCHNCHTTFLDMGFDSMEMSSLYLGYRSHEYNMARTKYEPSYALRSNGLNLGYQYLAEVEKEIEKYSSSSITTVFDWGGDTGINTPFKNAAEVTIYDPSGQAISAEKRTVITSLDGLQQSVYDLFVCMNVLEHLPSPLDSLQAILASVKASLFYFEVPLESFVLPLVKNNNKDFWIKKRHWHEHINCFTPHSFKTLIETCSLKVLSCRFCTYKNHGRDEKLITCIAVRSH